MSRDSGRLVDYLTHILEAIGRIERYTLAMDESAFMQNALVQDAVIRNLEVIGEASRKIQTLFPDFADKHPQLPLAAAYQMRNAVAHGYFKVDFGIVWATLKRDLPPLNEQIRMILRQLGADPNRLFP